MLYLIVQSVFEFLEGQELIMMKQPQYSAGLAHSDFWLLDYIKELLDNNICAKAKYAK